MLSDNFLKNPWKILAMELFFSFRGVFQAFIIFLYSRNKHLDMHFLKILLQIEVNYDVLSENRTTPM